MAHFFRASDAVDGAEREHLSQSRLPMLSSDRLGETQCYFGFKDAPALQEALRFLGPGVVDETLAAYYEHFLA